MCKTTYIVSHRDLRGVELFVVRASTGVVNETACYSANEQRVVNLELEHAVELLLLVLEHLVELWRVSWESVQMSNQREAPAQSHQQHRQHHWLYELNSHLLSLDDGAGEAVEDEAVLALWLDEVFLDEVDEDFVGNKLACIHDWLGLLADVGASSNSGAEEIACTRDGSSTASVSCAQFQQLLVCAVARFCFVPVARWQTQNSFLSSGAC